MTKYEASDKVNPFADHPADPRSAPVTQDVPWRDELPHEVTGEAATERAAVQGEPLRWIMRGILAWGVVLAAGVVWYDYDAGHVNAWKPIVILTAVSGFLAFWSYAIRRRAARASE